MQRLALAVIVVFCSGTAVAQPPALKKTTPPTAKKSPQTSSRRTARRVVLPEGTNLGQSRILPPALREKLPLLYRAGNPWASYSVWRHKNQDASWVAGTPWHAWYISWLCTGQPEYLERAKAMELRAAWSADISGGMRNALRQEGIDACVRYEVLSPHLSDEARREWERRLKLMGDTMLAHCRVGDLDECLASLAVWMLLDRDLGTQYMAARQGPGVESSPADVRDYIADVMSPQQVAGGFFDASTAYYMNNAQLWLLAGAALGPDALPGFDNWARQAAGYFANSVSYDLAIAQASGDMEGDGSETRLLHFRLGVMWSLIALGYDQDGQLASLAARLTSADGGPPTAPQHLYPAGQYTWAFLFLDPSDLPRADFRRGQAQGLYVVPGAGIVMHHGPQSSCFAHLLTPKRDDHAYVGSWIDAVWRLEGENILERPGGYSIGSNEWHTHNGLTFKNNGWFWKRAFLGAEPTASGFKARGTMVGPAERYYHDVKQRGSPNDFLNCQIVSTLALDGRTFTFGHEWSSPGNTFPSWTGELPVIQQVIHTRYEPRKIERGYEWTLPSGRVVKAVSREADEINVQAKGPWWAIHFASRRLTGKMQVAVSAGEPPPKRSQIQLAGYTWTFGAKQETLRDGVHVGAGLGSEYAIVNGTLLVRGTDGTWFRWTGERWERSPR